MSLLKARRPNKKGETIAESQHLQENTVRMNINVPRHFYKHIKQKALDKDMTVKDLVLEAIREYMSK